MKELSRKDRKELLDTLKTRFQKNIDRHKDLEWAKVQAKLDANREKSWSLKEMERTGGEPDVVGHDKRTHEYIFYDCSPESPKGRRSFCYDRAALESRKEHKPEENAIDMAAAIGIELLTEKQYRELQTLGSFDLKTSSWVKTPADIRKLGGALFCDRRYDTVFVYHNGAESYYAARGVPRLAKGLIEKRVWTQRSVGSVDIRYSPSFDTKFRRTSEQGSRMVVGRFSAFRG